jgi:hypothetical protein
MLHWRGTTMATVNFLNETIDTLERYSLSIDDVTIISEDGIIHKDLFVKLANVEYDDENPNCVINDELQMVGENFWFSRKSSDAIPGGWWEYHQKPDICNLKNLNENQIEILVKF